MPEFVSAWRVLKMIHELNKRRRTGDRQVVLRAQRENLDRLLRYALERSPYYRRRFSGEPERPRLMDFAPSDKAAVMGGFDEIVVDPALRLSDLLAFTSDPHAIGRTYRGHYVVAHTSGSTGTRGLFVIDQWGWEMGQALAFSSTDNPNFRWGWPRAILSPLVPLTAALVIPTSGHFVSVLMPRIKSPHSDRITKTVEIEISKPFDEIVAELSAIKPFALHSYPTMLGELAGARIEGRLNIRPWIVTSGGEPFTPDLIARVRRAWPKVPIYDIYACTEVLSIAKTCNHGRYHINEDWVVVEAADESGRVLPPGERGDRLYLTHLFNYLMPLVRYEVSDAATIDDTPCPCGQPLATIRVEGRANHTLVLPAVHGGVTRLLPVPILASAMEVVGLRNFQVIQEGERDLHVRYIPDSGVDSVALGASLEDFLRRYLQRNGAAPDVAIRMELVDRIERDKRTHKVVQIVNNHRGGAASSNPDSGAA